MSIEQGNQISDLYRRLNNLLRVGTVTEVDYAKAKAKVKIGKITTDYLPWMVPSTDTWFPLKNGEQVLVLSPNGNLSMGIIMPALYQSAMPAPSSDDKKVVIKADIEQTGDITTSGSITADGSVDAGGSITAKQEVTGNGVKLSDHTHQFQYVGAGQGATPQSGSTQKPS